MPTPPLPTENSKTSSGGNTTVSSSDVADNDDDDDDDDESGNGVLIHDDKRRDFFSPFDATDHSSTCSPPCSERTSCSNCTHGLCMWCKNLEMCIERNAYLVRPSQVKSKVAGDKGISETKSKQSPCSNCMHRPVTSWSNEAVHACISL